jgi:alkylation response protein AidB-like acyl-CoA dehydrogenase
VRKSYVTSAGHATHYTLFGIVEGMHTEGPANVLVVAADQVEWAVVGAWHGLGMRGNSSAPMRFNGTVPEEHVLGPDQPTAVLWGKYLGPVLILTYGAAYLGIAAGAFELVCVEGPDGESSPGSNGLVPGALANTPARLHGPAP